MSVSSPPLQQLPSSDFTIRRGIIADPGMVIIAADYAAVEMRVLAAMADVSRMKTLIAEGADLHTETARMVYGDAFAAASPSEQKKMRTLMKTVGFGKVYGGGPTGLARQSGLPYTQVKSAVDGYDSVYPEIAAYGKRLQRAAEFGKWDVTTPIGRVLPVDRDRSYAVTNYAVQSTARDLLAKAILDIEDAGLGEYLLLPVHDELVCQAPAADAERIIGEISKIMESTFMGVAIASEASVYGSSWGHGYGATS
jgi:DNA polymerase-1